jgi:hypothetical protein
MYRDADTILHILTSHSKVHVSSVRVTDKDFFPQAMADIYVEAHKTKAAGKGMFPFRSSVAPTNST